MHAEIAAAVAREHTPGLSPAACLRLEEALGRPPTVLELDVYAALLRRPDDMSDAVPLQIELEPEGAVALGVARGRPALTEAALDILAAGARPVAIIEGEGGSNPRSASDIAGTTGASRTVPTPLSAEAVAQHLGFASRLADFGPSAAGLGLAVGLLPGPAVKRRPPAAGDVLIYLGAPTERDSPSGFATGAPYMSPRPAANSPLFDLLRKLHERPVPVLAARLIGQGGLANAAARGPLGAQLALDTIPRHPAALPPRDLLLAETGARALVVVAAEQISEVLAVAQGQGVQAVVVGSLIADPRLRVLVKPLGSSAARPICELPLAVLDREPTGSPPPQRSRPEPSGAAEQWTPMLLHELRTMRPRQSPLVVLRQGPQPIALAACSLASAAHGADLVAAGVPSAARTALSAAVSQVYASGAVPARAVWLVPATAADPNLPAITGELNAACVGLGITGESGGAAAALTDGMVVVIGERLPAEDVAIGRFPGPGCLLAVLGFAGADAEQERAAGLLCGELVRSGLSVAVQPISHGGLLLALGRCCAHSGIGCTAVVATSQPAAEPAPQAERETLLGAALGRYLLAIPAQRQADARILASERGIPLWPLGRSGGSELVLRSSDGTSSFTELVRIPVAALAAELRRR